MQLDNVECGYYAMRYMRDIIANQECLTSKAYDDLLIFNISIFTLFFNVIDETVILLFNSFIGKNLTTKMS